MVTKKDKIAKTFTVLLDIISRCGFITAFLKAHDLDLVYSPGLNHGPNFKLSWTGSAYVYALIIISYIDPIGIQWWRVERNNNR